MLYNLLLIVSLIVFVELLNSSFNNQIIAYCSAILFLCSTICFVVKLDIFSLIILVVYVSVFIVFFFFSFYKNSLIMDNVKNFNKVILFYFILIFSAISYIMFCQPMGGNGSTYFWFDFVKTATTGHFKFNSVLHYLFFKVFFLENIFLNIILLVAVFSISSIFLSKTFTKKNIKVFLKNKKANKRKITAIK